MKQLSNNFRPWALRFALMGTFAGSSLLAHAQTGVFQVETSSYIADATNNDVLNGSRIQSNGNIVLAVDNTSSVIGGVTATTLNGATSTSAGTIVRLNSTGTTVLSVTKVGPRALDIAIDANDNIYVALGTGGFVKLNSTAQSVVYQNSNGGNCRRIDAGKNGNVVALNNSGNEAGKIYVYNPSGTELYNTAGKNFTQDVAINDELQLTYSIGFRNASTGCNPVQIAYIIARNFSGTEVWRDYDWAANLLDDCDGTARENNMADSRGYRITLGEDGKLYAAFEVAGGNHIFRFSPKNLTTPAPVVGGDAYTEFYNSRDEHKSFFARFDASNGNYLLGQQLASRPNGPTGPGNAVRIKDGDISADAQGRVYLGGSSADGLPLTFDVPEAGTSTGGAFLVAFSSDFKNRLFTTRLSGSEVHAVSARTVNGQVKTVFGGDVVGGLYVKNAIQSTPSGGTKDANFAVLKFAAGKSNPTVSITSPANGAPFNEGGSITIDATAADADGSVAKVDFYRDNVLVGTDTSAPFSFTLNNAPNGSYILRAKATDNEGFETYSPRVIVNVTVNAVNLVLGKPVTRSNQQTGNEAYKAVDGNVSTRWASLGYPQWMEVDLGAVKDMNRTEIVCYGDRAYRFKVETKTTADGAYTTVVDRTANTKTGKASDPIVDAFATTQAQYVKLTVTGEAGGAGWVGISEFRVFNTSSTPPVSNASPSVSLTS
uniref:Ig-like domain-containing protein n=1 Tax=Hymenobacter terrenus TaxID=1629124 RepID=UPI000A4448D1